MRTPRAEGRKTLHYKNKNKKKPRLIEREREKIEGLHETGLSLRAIARVTSQCTHTIRRVVSPAPPTPTKRLGPAPILLERLVRLVVRAAAQGDLSAAHLKVELNLPVSVRTVQRILAQVDWLVYSKMENTLPLTAANMAARKTWPKDMLLRKDAGSVWESITFSDEKKWNLDGPDEFQHYWRDLRQSVRQTKQRQAGGGSVMLWGAFNTRGKSPLVVLTARQNSHDYVYTVSEYILPFAHLNYDTDFLYQQGNASIHVSHRSNEFFNEEGIDVLEWPSKVARSQPHRKLVVNHE